jgi:hypothetical protein
MSDAANGRNSKIGVISCSGEEIAEGTVSRLATRRVLESLRPDVTVTLCLPLFVAGNEGERNFARTHPMITVDGCDKQCAKWATEKYGERPVSRAIVVSEILGTSGTSCCRSLRDQGAADHEAVRVVAEKIADEVDAVLGETSAGPGLAVSEEPEDGSVCACMKSLATGRLIVRGHEVDVQALPIVLAQCKERGVKADDSSGAVLLEMVKVFHYVAPEDEAEYRDALFKLYRVFLGE